MSGRPCPAFPQASRGLFPGLFPGSVTWSDSALRGDVLALLIASANRDPEVFADPDTFDHTRPVAAGRHLALGSGMHGCAGQVLARAEADIVFSSIVNRFSGVEPAGEPAYAHTEFLRTVTHLPVRFP
jgi:cytochrome P450